MNESEPFSVKKRIKSFLYALYGFKHLFKEEHNARIHLLAAIIVIIAGVYFNVSKIDWIILVLSIAIVFAAEAFNSAIEKIADAISIDQNPLLGKAKDLAAAGVLFVAIGVAITGIIIFYPYFIQLFIKA